VHSKTNKRIFALPAISPVSDKQQKLLRAVFDQWSIQSDQAPGVFIPTISDSEDEYPFERELSDLDAISLMHLNVK
jgi:hypothetical protein